MKYIPIHITKYKYLLPSPQYPKWSNALMQIIEYEWLKRKRWISEGELTTTEWVSCYHRMGILCQLAHRAKGFTMAGMR